MVAEEAQTESAQSESAQTEDAHTSNAWPARVRILRLLGFRGILSLTTTAAELFRLKRSLQRVGLRASLRNGEFALLFGNAGTGASSPNIDVQSVVKRETRIVRIAAKRVGATCLPSSIVLARRLRHVGFHPKVCIGVAKLPTGMAAHAWVELGGMPVGEDASAFSAFTGGEFDRALAAVASKP